LVVEGIAVTVEWGATGSEASTRIAMRRSALRGALVVVLLVLLSACSTMTVRSDYDPQASFSNLHTYDWLSVSQKVTGAPRLDNPLLDKRIRAAIETQLTTQGYESKASGTPDFYVGFFVTLENKTAVSTLNDWYGYRAGWGWSYGVGTGTRYPESYTYQYQQGTLIIDVSDPKTHQLIWRGSAEAEVNPNLSAEKRDARINEAVRRILERFPPKPKK
jgi:hypothetical protein